MNIKTEFPKDVYVIKGPADGPSIAIFAGIHGDERVGINALNKVIPNLKIPRGTLYVAFANPPAIQEGTRMVTKNLNRCFFEGNVGESYEDKRARELMAILDDCEALLDLHAYDDIKGEPFTICEPNSIDLASKLDLPILSTNWTNAEPGGTDAYMYLRGKIGLCAECGHIKKSEEYLDLAVTTIKQFLAYFEMSTEKVEFSNVPKRLIQAERGLVRTSEDFYLDPSLHSFDKLEPGKVYCSHDGEDYVAEEGECIIFPKPNAPINTEAFVIGREIPAEGVASYSRTPSFQLNK